MSVPFTPAATIDEVIQRLEKIIEYSIEKENALGFFTALYIVVTKKVKVGIEAGDIFEDNARMEKLDVIFANRYLEAFHLYRSGKQATPAWELAFKATEHFPAYIIMQELLAGINAHINLDLGIAVAEVAPGAQIEDLHNDFNAINAILGKLTDQMRMELNELSPRIGLIDRWLKGADDVILNFSLKKARDDAWDFAKALAVLPQADWATKISEKQEEVLKFGKLVLSPGLIPSLFVWWIKRKESKNIPEIIMGIQNAAGVIAGRIG